MRKRWILSIVAAAIALPLLAAPILLAPAHQPPPSPAAPPIDPAEHARTVEAMRPPKRERPVIAILALNAGTEVTDFLVPYGVLRRADVADVTVVAEHATPVPLHPFSRLGRGPELLRVDPESTMRAFDERYPDGADYVFVPAVEPRNDPSALHWIAAQRQKSAKIVSVCAGALTLAAAGLLDGRRATTHWAYVEELRKAHPTLQWVPDRRYVADDGIVTSTGITASIPVIVTLVEAIAGRAKAESLAAELGLANWDARHRSSAFQLTTEDKKTFVRNWLSFWRHETVGVPVPDGVDEIALGLTADAYSRTALSKVMTFGNAATVRSKHGLTLHPQASTRPAVDQMLPPPGADAPAQTMDKELAKIATRFDRPTADIVALVVEYPWIERARQASR